MELFISKIEHIVPMMPGDGIGQLAHAALTEHRAQSLHGHSQASRVIKFLVSPYLLQKIDVCNVPIGTTCQSLQQPEPPGISQKQRFVSPDDRKCAFVQQWVVRNFPATMPAPAIAAGADPAIIHTVADAMASLEHEYDTACSQEEALKRMAEKSYSYILLDIQIPARAQNGVARIQNTENLLEKINGKGKGKAAPPIVILSDYVVSGLEPTVDLMRLALSLGRKGVAGSAIIGPDR